MLLARGGVGGTVTGGRKAEGGGEGYTGVTADGGIVGRFGGEGMAYTDGKWSASSVGMTASELELIPTNAWSSVMNSAKVMKLKAMIDGTDTVTEVKFNFNNNPVARVYTWQEMKDRFTWSQVANYTWKFFKGVD